MSQSKKQHSEPIKADFWTSKRLQIIASLTCWDILLSLQDQQIRTAAELADLIGRTPGALHTPLQTLVDAGIIQISEANETGSDKTRGRPARRYAITPDALQPPCSQGSAYEHAVHKATAAGLRLVMRNSELLAHENIRRHRTKESALRCQRWIQFGHLNDEDIDAIDEHFAAILKLLSQRRSGGGGRRYRVALMMLPDNFTDD